VANDAFVSSLFNQLDKNKNGIIIQGGSRNEYSQVVVENAIAELLRQQQAGSAQPPAQVWTAAGYLSKNPDISQSWEKMSAVEKQQFSSDKNKYAAWHYEKYGKNEGRQFFTGGYTGPGGVLEEAGIVHKGEVVFSQADVSRWGGWQAVEQLRKGPQLSISAPSMAPSGAAGGNIVLIEELRQMRNELEMMRYETKATAINTGRTQDLMRRVTRNGEAMQTEAFAP
jgi:hypothetical protein